MGIAFFVAAASNLRGEFKVNLVVLSTRTYVHLHPGSIGNLVAIFKAPETFCFGHGNSYGTEDRVETQNAATGSQCGVRRHTVWDIKPNMTDSLSAGHRHAAYHRPLD